jgi:chromosome segregation ATPase
MEAPIVDLRYYKAVADKRNQVLALWKTHNEKLAEIDKQREDCEDSIDLLEDEMHYILEDAPVDFVEYKAMKAEMAMTVDALEQIKMERASVEASLEKVEEESKMLKKTLLDMKRILQNRGKLIPFKKESNEG